MPRLVALAAVLTAPLWPATAIARPETPPNVKTGKGKIRVWHDPRLRVIRPYRGWLARVRACESGGRYTAVNPSGIYTGAYQFDTQTWRSVGGRGIARWASPREQDFRAVLLLRRRGSSPWPVCGV